MIRPSSKVNITPATAASLKIPCANITLAGDSPTWLYNAGAWSRISGQVIRGRAIQVGQNADSLNYQNITIEGLALDGMTNGNTDYGFQGSANTNTGDAWDTSNQAISSVDTSTGVVTIRNNTIQNFKGELIVFNGAAHSGLAVINNVLQNTNGDAISTSDVRFTATGNYIANVGNSCIENGVMNNITVYYHISGNQCYNAERNAIALPSVSSSSGAAGILVSGNVVSGCGITQAGGHTSSTLACVDIDYQTGSRGTVSNVQIINNQFKDFEAGVNVNAADTLTVNGNTFTVDAFYGDSIQTGIRMNGDGGPNTMCSNCVIENNNFGRSAAAIAGSHSYIPIWGLEGSATNAVWTNVTVKNNTANTGQGWRNQLTNNVLSSSWAAVQKQAMAWSGNTCNSCTFSLQYGLESLTPAANIIYPLTDWVQVSPNTNLSATVTTTKVQNGHTLRVTNASPYIVTFGSDSNTSVPNTVTLSRNEDIYLLYSAALSRWVYQSTNALAPSRQRNTDCNKFGTADVVNSRLITRWQPKFTTRSWLVPAPAVDGSRRN